MNDCAVHERAKKLLRELLDLDFGNSLPLEDSTRDEGYRQNLAYGRVWIRAAMLAVNGVVESPCDAGTEQAFMEFLDDVERQSSAMREAMLA